MLRCCTSDSDGMLGNNQWQLEASAAYLGDTIKHRTHLYFPVTRRQRSRCIHDELRRLVCGDQRGLDQGSVVCKEDTLCVIAAVKTQILAGQT